MGWLRPSVSPLGDGCRFWEAQAAYGLDHSGFRSKKALMQEDIKASFKDGILKVSVPKKKAIPQVEENRYITIEG